MNVQELIDRLQEMNPEAEVRFASQPSWPFEYSIEKVVEIKPDTIHELATEFFEEGQAETMEEALEMAEKQIANISQDPVVYLEEGSQLGYLPEKVKNEIGW